MSPMTIGLLIFAVTCGVLATGMPIAFALGGVALFFMILFEGWNSINFLPETVFSGLNDFTLVSLPMFVIMGAAVASSRAGSDLYEALSRWLHRIPGSLVISNIGACALFAALTGSSPATCAAIGKMGIPEMRRRGYDADLATGAIAAGGTLGILIPPSITMILYGIASETSIGRLFIAGIIPGLLLTALFMAWAMFLSWKRGTKLIDRDRIYSMKEKLELMPRLLPFILVIIGVVYALYGGIATPSEAAGVGAALCLVMVVVIYRLWRIADIWHILRDGLRESGMLMLIIGTSILFGYMMSSLQVTQAVAASIGDLHVNRWWIMIAINVLLLVAGCFLPPAAIILMTTPILMPIIIASKFDPIWFGVILTINMEIGLIHPPVGLNIYIVNAIAPDVPLAQVMWGTLPYVVCMMLAIVILCIFPEIATWLPDHLMGVAIGPK
jgi:C4-dicarboxylate transporter, DctM subunit